MESKNKGEREKEFKVATAQRLDSKRVWEIRNHPLVRQTAHSQEEIPFEQHDRWFENKYFKETNNRLFVLKDADKVIGYCRFDFDKEHNSYLVSIALDTEYQGKGLGHKLLSQALQQLDVPQEILAEVRKGNEISVKLFEKNNFQIYKEDKNTFYLKLKKPVENE